jgi:hypothetical protein
MYSICLPVIEEAPNNPEGSVEEIGNDGHPCKEVVLIDEGEAKSLGEIYDDALGKLDTQEANPDLKQICPS